MDACGGSKYAKYVVKEPRLLTEMAHHDFTAVSGITFPDEVFLDKHLVPDSDSWLDIMWIWEIPNPPDLLGAHAHPFDELVLLIGSNPRNTKDFGGSEIEWFMGEGDEAERFVVDTTTLIYVPKGLVHGPMNFLKIDMPVLNVAIGLTTGEYL